MAAKQAQQFIQGGKRWVIDMDLEKFFDRVDHDIHVELTESLKINGFETHPPVFEADMWNGMSI